MATILVLVKFLKMKAGHTFQLNFSMHQKVVSFKKLNLLKGFFYRPVVDFKIVR